MALALMAALSQGAAATPGGGALEARGRLHFRFSAKDPKTYSYVLRSNAPAIDGLTGGITSVLPSPERAQAPSSRLPNWWTDDPSPAAAEGVHHGARTVSRWRQDFLRDFSRRMDRTH